MAAQLPQEAEPPTDRSYGMVTLRYTSSPSSNTASASASTASPPEPTKSTTNNLQVLLIHQKTLNSGPPFWTFPKGHPEPGDETLLDTARRELLEETGVVVGKQDVLCFPSPTPDSKQDREKAEGEEAATELTLEERYRIPYKPKPTPSDSQNPSSNPPQEPPKESSPPKSPEKAQQSENSTFQEPYTSPNRTRGKVVTYYVAFLPPHHRVNQDPNQELKLQEKEVAAAKWMSLDEAMVTIQFPEGREVLRGVREAIEKVGGVKMCGRMGPNDGGAKDGAKDGKL